MWGNFPPLLPVKTAKWLCSWVPLFELAKHNRERFFSIQNFLRIPYVLRSKKITGRVELLENFEEGLQG